MKRALVIASVASMIDQFNMPNIRLLQELGYEVDVACNFIYGSTCSDEKIAQLKETLKSMDVQCYQIDFARNVTKIGQNLKALREIKKLLNDKHYDLIHCHSPIGGLLTRLAANKHRKNGTKVIYTAHGFHFYKGAPLVNWLVYFPIEYFAAFKTDILITINQEDYNFSKKHIHAKKIMYVPGIGIDTKKFSKGVLTHAERIQKRTELKIEDNEIMLLSVGELIKRKNHEAVIRALKQTDNQNWKYFIAGKGILNDYLENLINEQNMQDKVFLLGFRNDISELCDCADYFIFPSFQEGLPVALMEAIASSTPVVCSNIRGNTDLVDPDSCFDPTDVNDIAVKIDRAIMTPQNAVNDICKANHDKLKAFDIDTVQEEMRKIYDQNSIC